jgi:hypothetical protein
MESSDDDEGEASPALALLWDMKDSLSAHVAELQGRWEALGDELEAKRHRLKLVEDTLERLASLQGSRGQEGGEEEEDEDRKEVSAQIVCLYDCQATASHVSLYCHHRHIWAASVPIRQQRPRTGSTRHIA